MLRLDELPPMLDDSSTFWLHELLLTLRLDELPPRSRWDKLLQRVEMLDEQSSSLQLDEHSLSWSSSRLDEQSSLLS